MITQTTHRSNAVVVIPFESRIKPKSDTIYIDREISQLCPPLLPSELEQLEANLVSDGCRDPLVVWAGCGLIVDGHHRYEICSRLGIQYNLIEKEFNSKESAIAWVIGNQLGRRNLTSEAISYLRGIRYNLEVSPKGKNHHFDGSTSARLGAEYKVGQATIERDAKFATAVNELSQDNPEIKRQILSGETSLTKRQIRDLGEVAKTDREKAIDRFLELNRNQILTLTKRKQRKKKPRLIDSIVKDFNKVYPYLVGDWVEILDVAGGWDVGDRSEVIDVSVENQQVRLLTYEAENKESWVNWSLVKKVTTPRHQLPQSLLTINLQGKIIPKARPRVSENGTYFPQAYQDWRSSAKGEVLALIRSSGVSIPVPKPCHLSLTMRGQSMRADIDNLAGAVMDCLVSAGVLAQDNLGHVSKLCVEHIQSDSPECEIEILVPRK